MWKEEKNNPSVSWHLKRQSAFIVDLDREETKMKKRFPQGFCDFQPIVIDPAQYSRPNPKIRRIEILVISGFETIPTAVYNKLIVINRLLKIIVNNLVIY